MHISTKNNQIEVTRILLENGACPNAESKVDGAVFNMTHFLYTGSVSHNLTKVDGAVFNMTHFLYTGSAAHNLT